MSKEAMKLALEALEQLDGIDTETECVTIDVGDVITALREALAEREAVLPGGGHVPAVPVAVYGYCPECGGAGVMRERRPNGDDKCTNGHKYPSSQALAEQPAQQEPVAAQSVMTVRIWRDKNSDQNAEFKNWHKLPDGEHILYTPPTAQRTWVGLTQEEFRDFASTFEYGTGGLIRAIEAKLKEKNT